MHGTEPGNITFLDLTWYQGILWSITLQKAKRYSDTLIYYAYTNVEKPVIIVSILLKFNWLVISSALYFNLAGLLLWKFYQTWQKRRMCIYGGLEIKLFFLNCEKQPIFYIRYTMIYLDVGQEQKRIFKIFTKAY